MSDPDPKTLMAEDGNPPPIDWHVVEPTLKLRWLAGIALVVPLLLAAGVYWLHHTLANAGPRVADAVVEVRLITLQEQNERRQDAPQPPIQAAPNPQSERLVEAVDRSIPAETVALAPAEPSPPIPPAAASAPVSLGAPGSPTDQTAQLFQRALLSHIKRYRRYPDEARRDRIQGTVQMMFAMQRDGTVTDVWIKSSSGHNALDIAALDTIRRAQPLPKIPPGLPDRLNILMPVAFDLP